MKTIFLRETHAFSSRSTIRSLILISLFSLLTGLFLLPSPVQAAPLRGFEARPVSVPSSIVMDPGSVQELELTFENIGDQSWRRTGWKHVSIYTHGPKYRASVFRTDAWENFTQASFLEEALVRSGEEGTIRLELKAPLSEGLYTETFWLAAEDVAWIPGGEFSIQIRVQDDSADDVVASPVSDSSDSETSSGSASETIATTEKLASSLPDGTPSEEVNGYSAMVLLRSEKKVVAEAGEVIDYKIGLKNTGSRGWNTREILANDLAIASASTSHASWVSSSKLVSNEAGVVKPGALDFFTFQFTAPTTKGEHLVRYRLAANDTIVPDFYIDIPVEVTSGAPSILNEEVVVSEEEFESVRVIEEPIVRIGLLTIDDETDWVTEISCDTQWRLEDEEGGLLGLMGKDEMVRAFYKNKRYYYNRGKGIEQTHKYLRFVPDDEDAICTIENFDRRVTRNAGYAWNQFRDTLELRYIPYKDEVWVINELPIEEYLYGLGETSNLSHEQFKKVLLVAARTYALYHWERETKHRGYFHMNAYADDQVYFGYGYELVHPLIKESVEETRGVTVNYQGHTAITPYFSRSSGHTSSWSDVWGGSVPWVIGVPAPCDAKKGRTQWGHGVGMSASEALCMAKEGSTWEEILQYFYTDIELQKRWE